MIAIALAMDAFAVAVAAGISLKKLHFRHIFRLTWHFGLFQSLMTFIGWALGLSFLKWIEKFDHWLAFILLVIIGVKMIWENFQSEDEIQMKKNADPTKGFTLIILSTATSIDALAVGLSLSMLKTTIWYPVLMIGIVAALFTYIGLHLGRYMVSFSKLAHYAAIIGGLILIGIGINILYEHGALGDF